jgi:HD-GYP domain-containing protein (c-di-GMP phosphodiesterase class II)
MCSSLAPMRLAELAAVLAHASELGSALPTDTSLRTALIAMAMTRGLPSEDRRVVYYASLLRHIGCTARAPEEPAVGLFARALRAVRSAMAASTVTPITLRARCEAAVRFAERLAMDERVARALDQVYTRFDGSGYPAGMRGDAITIEARWIAVAEVAAIAFATSGSAGATAAVRARRGTELDPLLADAFLADPTRMLSDLAGSSLVAVTLDAEPPPASMVTDERLLAFAEVVADFADQKSPYFVGHSRGVADLACRAGRTMGLPDERLHELRLAALFHDVGRVAISSAIWDKRDKLDARERELVQTHTSATDRILGQSDALKPIARLASQAHERIDGTGYHRKLPATAIGTASRVLAVADVAHALGEARPHRPAYAREEIGKILIQLARNGSLDPRAVDAVVLAMEQLTSPGTS